MSSRRHHHSCSHLQNHHHEYIPLIATSPHCCNQSNHPPPPPPDNLLHLLTSYLQNQQQQEKQCPDVTCSCETPRFNGIRRNHHQHQHKNVTRINDDGVLSCLLRKIDDLESSLNKFSARYDQRRDRYSTLRDSAARVIQTHFHSYLVQRSISFRHLKELATIKSCFLSLKSSVLGKPHFNFKAVSRKATDLLMELDSIQGRIDPMIRSSKRSLSRDLVRFLQYIDDCAVKRYDFVGKSTINVSFGGSASKLRGSDGKKPQGFSVAEDRTMEKLRNRIGKVFVTSGGDEDNTGELEDLDLMTDSDDDVPVIVKRKVGSSRSRMSNEQKPLVRKPVVVDKKKNVYQVYGDTHDLTSSGEDDDSVDGGEEIVMMSRPSSKTRNMVLVKGSGGKNKVGKTVSFDEKGNLYKVYGDTTESSVSEEDESTDGSNDGNGEEKGNENVAGEIKYVTKENKGLQEEEEETNSENEVSSSEGSEGDAIVTKDANHAGNNEHTRDIQLQKGSSMFSPPLPLKMES